MASSIEDIFFFCPLFGSFSNHADGNFGSEEAPHTVKLIRF